MLRKILRIALIIMVILLGAAFAAPFLFKGKIISLARQELNENLQARADFRDLDISFFRSFPRVSLGLESLEITGINYFSKDTLLSAKRLDIAINFMSLFNRHGIKVYSVELHEPRIHAIVLKNGMANWDIMKPASPGEKPSSDPGTFQLELSRYTISNAYLQYRDEEGSMYAELTGFNHEGSGNFGADLFTLSTKTSATSTSFSYGGIPYLNNAAVKIDADFSVDTKNSSIQFSKAQASLNGLKLNSDGSFAILNDSTYGMDIHFDAPAVDFKSILSLVPSIYNHNFDGIKSGGTALFNGSIRGKYGPSEIPAYQLNLQISNGFFQYPDLPKPVKNINLAVKVDNPDGVTDHTVIDIRNGHMEMDNMPFDFRLLVKQPLSDRYIEGAVKGKLDLSQLIHYVKLDPGTRLAGNLEADIEAKGNLSVIQQQKTGEFSAKGFLDISNLYYASAKFPQPIQHTSAKIIIENPDGIADHTIIKIPVAHLELGKDIADITLLIKNPATDPNLSGTARGTMNLGNVSQFYTFEPGTKLNGNLSANLAFSGKKSQVDQKKYDAIQLSGDLNGENIAYVSRDYKDGLLVKKANLQFTPKNVIINQIDGNFEQTNFTTSGTFDNLVGYALKDEPLKGTLTLSADKIDLNQWMGTDTAGSTSGNASTPFAVPKNIDFTINAKASTVHYDKVEYTQVSASMLVKDEKIDLKNVQMNALDGTIAMNGYYSTKDNKQKPEISLAYDVKNLDVQKTFMAFNTIRKLMPVGQFISGRLNSQLSMHGLLGQDMMPDLASLTGNGNLLLIEGFLKKFAPLDKMASTLNVRELEGISLKDVKNYFAFANGKVLVKPFKLKVKDIDMEIGGMHGLDQSIDYQVNMKIPRAMMGSQGNAYLDKLAIQAGNNGVPVKLSDMVNLKVLLGGTMTKPAIRTDLKQSVQSLADDLKKQTTDFVQARADSAKKATRDTAIAIRDKLVTDTRDELVSRLTGNKDSSGSNKGLTLNDSKKRLENAGKDLFKNAFKKKKPADSTNR